MTATTAARMRQKSTLTTMAAVLVWCELEWAWSLDTSAVLRTQQLTVIGMRHILHETHAHASGATLRSYTRAKLIYMSAHQALNSYTVKKSSTRLYRNTCNIYAPVQYIHTCTSHLR